MAARVTYTNFISPGQVQAALAEWGYGTLSADQQGFVRHNLNLAVGSWHVANEHRIGPKSNASNLLELYSTTDQWEWQDPKPIVTSREIETLLWTLEQHLIAAQNALAGPRQGLHKKPQARFETYGCVIGSLDASKFQKFGQESGQLFLKDFCRRARTVASACAKARLQLQDRSRPGPKPTDWIRHIDDAATLICETNNISTKISPNRVDPERTRGLVAVVEQLLSLLPNLMRLRSPEALAIALRRSRAKRKMPKHGS